MHKSQPVLWSELINEAEELRVRSGWGLASVWQWIHRDDYRNARLALDDAQAAVTTSTHPTTRGAATMIQEPRSCEAYCDFCAQCAAESGCSRFDAVHEPEELHLSSGAAVSTITASYRCGCGHEWSCAWSTLHASTGA